jgi:hypothetical protein
LSQAKRVLIHPERALIGYENINCLEIVWTVGSPSPRPLPQRGGEGKGEGASTRRYNYATLNNYLSHIPIRAARVADRITLTQVTFILHEKRQMATNILMHWKRLAINLQDPPIDEFKSRGVDLGVFVDTKH